MPPPPPSSGSRTTWSSSRAGFRCSSDSVACASRPKRSTASRTTTDEPPRIGSQGSRLSGGERQRLAIARTLLSRRRVILLDEPTAHLDEETAAALLRDLREALNDRIVVLVAHHADDIRPEDARLSLDRENASFPAH